MLTLQLSNMIHGTNHQPYKRDHYLNTSISTKSRRLLVHSYKDNAIIIIIIIMVDKDYLTASARLKIV